MNEANENLNARSGASVGVAVSTAAVEQTQAKGVYRFTCLEPKPEYKSEYDALFQRHMALLSGGYIEQAQAVMRGADMGRMQPVWEAEANNVVCTLGKNAMLDNFLAGSGFTQTGPYMGLISSASWMATAAGDTAAQINGTNGWKEAGAANAPTFAARVAVGFSSASAGAKTATTTTFTMTGAGTVEGAFLVLGSGASSTIANTGGTLFSAGAFTGGAQTVSATNLVAVSYSISV